MNGNRIKGISKGIGKIAGGSVAGALLLFVLMLCVGSPLLYHADNLTFCHALYLNEKPSPHWLHPSYLLSYPLCAAAYCAPWVNWYLLYLYALLAGSAAAVLHITRAADKPLTLRVAGVVTAAYIIFEVPMKMEYAWISFLAAGCGCALLFHRLFRGETGVRRLLPGLALFAGGAVLRFDSCPGFAPFICAAALFCLLPGAAAGKGLRARATLLAAPIGALAFLAGVFALQPLPAGKTWQGDGNVVEINRIRMSFRDYADRSGVDKTAAYAAAGLPRSYFDILENYFCNDERLMTTPRWERIARIRQADNPAYEWGGRFWEELADILIVCHNRFLLLALLAVWGVWLRRGVWRWYPIAMAGCYFLGILICCARGRCYITPIMSLAYFYVPMLLIPCGLKGSRSLRIVPRLAAHGPAAALWLAIAALLALHHDRLHPFGGFRHLYADMPARAALVQWMQENPEALVLADCYIYRDLAYPDAPLFHPQSPYPPRFIELGNWPTTLPYRQTQRQGYGLDNEVLALADPRVRLLLKQDGLEYIPLLLKHLREVYGIRLELVPVQELGNGYTLYSLVTDS